MLELEAVLEAHGRPDAHAVFSSLAPLRALSMPNYVSQRPALCLAAAHSGSPQLSDAFYYLRHFVSTSMLFFSVLFIVLSFVSLSFHLYIDFHLFSSFALISHC